MTSRISLSRCVSFVSASLVSLIRVYKFGRNQPWKDTFFPSSPSHLMLVLEEGQTILAVVDRVNSIHFYIGDETNDKDYE